MLIEALALRPLATTMPAVHPLLSASRNWLELVGSRSLRDQALLLTFRRGWGAGRAGGRGSRSGFVADTAMRSGIRIPVAMALMKIWRTRLSSGSRNGTGTLRAACGHDQPLDGTYVAVTNGL